MVSLLLGLHFILNGLVLAICAHIVLVSASLIEPWNRYRLKASMTKINKYLVKTTDSKDAHLNLDLASLWADQLRDHESCLPLFSPTRLIQAIDLFTRLQEVRRDRECDERTYSIILNLISVLQINMVDIYLNPEAPRTRIHQVAAQVLTEHAKGCRYVHPVRLMQARSHLDEKKLALVDEATRSLLAVMPGGFKGEGDYFAEKVSAALLKLLRKWTLKSSGRDIMKSIEDQINGRHIKMELKQLKKIYSDHLLKPCTYFKQELDSPLVLAYYNSKIYPADLRHDPKTYEVWLALQSVDMCTRLGKEKQTILQALHDLLTSH